MNSPRFLRRRIHIRLSRPVLWLRHRFRTAVLNPVVTLGLGLGLLGLVLPFQWALTAEVAPLSRAALFVATVLAVAVLTMLVGGHLYLRSAAAPLYADVLIRGRPAREIFVVLTREGASVIQEVLDLEKSMRRLYRRLLTEIRKTARAGRAQADPELDRRFVKANDLRKLLASNQRARLQRMEAMKVAAADELGIPARRLCDHILQYSPSLHRDRYAKFVQNWGEMSRTYHRRRTSVASARFRAIRTECRAIQHEFETRKWLLLQLANYPEHHEDLVAIASTHSTSASVRNYIDSLRHGVEFTLASADDSHLVQQASTRLVFLARKQRAHAGYDVHSLLINALRVSRTGTIDGIRVDDLLRILEAMKTFRPERVMRALAGVDDSPEQLLLSLDSTSPRNRLAALGNLAGTIFEQSSAATRGMVRLADELLLKEFGDAEGNLYLVTHGYSRTIRDVLTRQRSEIYQTGYPARLEDLSHRSRAYIIESGGERSLDTRRMAYEIRRAPRGRKIPLAIGSVQNLAAMIGKGDGVAVLLGAEAFDERGRMLHPLALMDDLSSFKSNIKACTPLVVAIAESYKRVPDLLSDAVLYSDHVDRVQLYSAGVIDWFITEEGAYERLPDRTTGECRLHHRFGEPADPDATRSPRPANPPSASDPASGVGVP